MPAHMDPRLRKPGKKTVALGVGLTFVGCVLLGCYLLWYFGFMPIPDDEERGTSLALLVLGCITLAPGLYVTTILAAVWRGDTGVHVRDDTLVRGLMSSVGVIRIHVENK